MDLVNRFLSKLSERQDLVFVLLFALVVAMLVVPLPTFLIDILLAVNICLSVLILMVALYLKNVLDLSTFPAIILVSTIFRLALTVSTTRLILAQGDAGKIIAAFGNFVVAGNVVVGLVIFFIVAIVQFIVVTKGAERIAEVSARFTLDALPGKQMAIDADVRAGEATKEEARRRRFILEKESQLFGSMDGAMRFVKGDAIASLVIVFVNLCGGILIGTLQKGMPFRDAMKIYSLLTIGDGLVSQIPSMLIAVAAGMVVTRVVTENSIDLGQDIGSQLASEPRTLGVASGLSACLAFVPGFPSIVFIILATFLGGFAWMITKRRQSAATASAGTAIASSPEPQIPECFKDAPIGAFVSLAGSFALKEQLIQSGAELSKAIEEELGHQSFEYGFPIRRFAYRIRNRLDGLHVLISDKSVGKIDNPLSRDPEEVGIDIWNCIKPHISKMFDSETALNWLTACKQSFPGAAAEIEQSVRPLFIADVVRELLEDGLTLAQPRPVLEALMRAKEQNLSPTEAAELARMGLRQNLLQSRIAPDGELPAIIIDFGFEILLRQMAQRISESRLLAARDPSLAPALAQIKSMAADADVAKLAPVVICQGDVRRLLRSLLHASNLAIPIVSLGEIEPSIVLKPLGTAGHQPQSWPGGSGQRG
jgi:type III secretion protein V